MKCTYVGPLPRPTLCGTYVSFAVTASLPQTGIAKDLPPLPAGHHEAWTLYVTRRQWERVAQVFRTEAQERAICEGIAVVRPEGNFLWVTALKSVTLEKQRQEQQKAAAQAVG
jgi:hypothetical protein